MLRSNSLTGQVGFVRREQDWEQQWHVFHLQKLNNYQARSYNSRFWLSNDIDVKCGVQNAQCSRQNSSQLHLPSNHHLKLCAREHLQGWVECRLCLTLMTPGAKMSPYVWISCPDTERSHQFPRVFTHRKFKFSSSSSECRLHLRLQTGDDGSPW